MSTEKRQIAEQLIEDFGTALATIVRQSFPNLPIRVKLQKGRRLGVLVYWDGPLEEGDAGTPVITYPAIHKATADLRITEYGREKLRLQR